MALNIIGAFIQHDSLITAMRNKSMIAPFVISGSLIVYFCPPFSLYFLERYVSETVEFLFVNLFLFKFTIKSDIYVATKYRVRIFFFITVLILTQSCISKFERWQR